MIFCTECSTLEEMAVESMTVHPNSPTANHEHNSLLTDERSSNTIIFLSNYWFVLCFFPKTKSTGICFFFSFKGIKVAFSGKRTEVTKSHLETLHSAIRKLTNESGKHSEYDQIYIFSHFSKLFKRSKIMGPPLRQNTAPVTQCFHHR